MPIQATRTLLHSALSGRLLEAEYRRDPLFDFMVPVEVPGIDPELLDPRATWSDPEEYDRRAGELAAMFRDNFERFADEAGPEVAAAGPQL
jgi:phosphoenolpyruvate carboxykinase (ATP)